MGPELKRRTSLRPFIAIGLIAVFVGLFMLKSCTPDPKPSVPVVVPATTLVPTPPFSADSAYAYVARQVAFGPRVPGSKEHAACADWLVTMLNAFGADTVYQQRASVTAFNGQPVPLRNIIASWNSSAKERILLMAHYDTRPFADHDDERQNQPIDGANDGASGVGVLLEIARHLSSNAGSKPALGIDIFFTDVEDMGQPNQGVMGAGMDEKSIKTWCLGSQYWVKNPHVVDYKARFGILLDMVGSTDARFPREALSMRFAPQVVNRIWKAASATGHGDRFLSETRSFVGIDDHVVVTEGTGIPVADIIAWDATTNAFPKTWHTHDDNLASIDKSSLEAVGTTVMQVVWAEK
ncbi:MAG: M28 family peptidase [Flavobacteriales bacterium]|nr:M28 family peptidase [Flavobacteriales bacterium]